MRLRLLAVEVSSSRRASIATRSWTFPLAPPVGDAPLFALLDALSGSLSSPDSYSDSDEDDDEADEDCDGDDGSREFLLSLFDDELEDLEDSLESPSDGGVDGVVCFTWRLRCGSDSEPPVSSAAGSPPAAQSQSPGLELLPPRNLTSGTTFFVIDAVHCGSLRVFVVVFEDVLDVADERC